MIKKIFPLFFVVGAFSFGFWSIHAPYTPSLTKQSKRGLASSQNYCIALRGNGEAMPAHWGALAQVIETQGIPAGIAGGSSASISAFLLESILLNPSLDQSNEERAAEQVAFLLKSFEGFAVMQASKTEWQTLFSILQSTQGSTGFIDLKNYLLSKPPAKIKEELEVLSRHMANLVAEPLFYGPLVVRVLSLMKQPENPQLPVAIAQLREAIRVFGAFDAKNDQALFIRDGIVFFDGLTQSFGKLANFYSLRGAMPHLKNEFSKFVRDCSVESRGKAWREIAQRKPECQNQLGKLWAQYVQPQANSREDDMVSGTLKTIITTSVVVGTSAERYRKAKIDYDQKGTLPQSNGGQANPFQLASNDLWFGYWSDAGTLAQIESNLSLDDYNFEKTERFLKLGETKWQVALNLSPAEPGLSSFQEGPATVGLTNWLSFGGWSDLHPVPVLKASGCQRVTYITRRGGDSLFAQGVTKRLIGYELPTWEELDPKDKTVVEKNRTGRADISEGFWHATYNMANPKSSLRGSMELADHVLCTNWDIYDVKTQFKELIADSYQAPLIPQAELANSLCGFK